MRECSVYQIRNRVNGKSYVGVSTHKRTPEQRKALSQRMILWHAERKRIQLETYNGK